MAHANIWLTYLEFWRAWRDVRAWISSLFPGRSIRRRRIWSGPGWRPTTFLSISRTKCRPQFWLRPGHRRRSGPGSRRPGRKRPRLARIPGPTQSVKAPRSLGQLKKLLPAGDLLLDPATLENYAGDKWFASHLPEAVALPRSTASVAQILRFASAHRIPVTARGAGFGYVGGCVPARGGIVLSLARMNRIKEIHAGDFVAVAEAGVILQTLAGRGGKASGCIIRPTRPAAPIAAWAARWPPTPAARAASNTA